MGIQMLMIDTLTGFESITEIEAFKNEIAKLPRDRWETEAAWESVRMAEKALLEREQHEQKRG
ncbi:MAG: hypothetical protein RIC36_17010 [Rhodospirillales bacterium]